MSIRSELNVQWHITTDCSNHCKHCYMFEEKTYKNEKKNTLSLSDLIKILEDFKQFEKKYSTNISNIIISGGDPLLRKDIFEFLYELKKRKKNILLLGNPNTINEKIINEVKKVLDSKGKKLKNNNKMDGVRFDFDNGWILVRRSGTSPYLRISGESSVNLESSKEMNELVQEKMEKLDLI